MRVRMRWLAQRLRLRWLDPGALFFRKWARQWSAATFGVPMTNNKGPQVRLAWACRAVLCDREALGQKRSPNSNPNKHSSPQNLLNQL